LDLYRLETPEEIQSAGVEEFLEPNGVAVIEWAEKLESLAGQFGQVRLTRLKIEILSEMDRRITYDNFSA
ncbi:MAG TPA: tRNA (adenosine(37)-N6)-threonylcarbamoyltransferase complex ATPase subunit type 1 TsaE, partial [Verrucomicrobiae bacterium]|nr:tRNA (adenosine(37)-N6)-threonylcarbamoyltransferase complex ATPase subunit type 1 TsaE [Verrucomicrobiae bacterium]